jgi:hypothetical protein
MKKLVKKIILWLYIKKAKQHYKMTGKQTFVVPVVNFGKRKYTLIDKLSHDAYNRQAKKMGKKQITYPELLTMCVFKTEVGTTKARAL